MAVAGGVERSGGSPGINGLDCLRQDEAQGQGYEKQVPGNRKACKLPLTHLLGIVMGWLPYFNESLEILPGNNGLIGNLFIHSLIIFTSNLSVYLVPKPQII